MEHGRIEIGIGMEFRRLLLMLSVALVVAATACTGEETPDISVSTSLPTGETPSTSVPAEPTTTAAPTTTVAPAETTTSVAADDDGDINAGLVVLIIAIVLVLAVLVGWLVGRNRGSNRWGSASASTPAGHRRRRATHGGVGRTTPICVEIGGV